MKKFVYVIDWGKHYSNLTKWNEDTKQRENIFPIKTILPNYCGIEHHWERIYEPNLTLKGTINKREPEKLVKKIPKYKDYKWEIIERFKHPKAGEYFYTQEERGIKGWPDHKYPEEDLLLLASTHIDVKHLKCYIIIEETGVSELTPEQYADKQFNALIESNLGKWDRDASNKEKIPKEIISRFYDSNDNVLFGVSMVKGLVSYEYLEGKFSTDGKPIYLGCSILYDGKGNSGLNDSEKDLIKSFAYIKAYVWQT